MAVVFSHGEYSDYQFGQVYICTQDFNYIKEAKKFYFEDAERQWNENKNHWFYVDWLDFERRDNGVFIAGRNYPSVDHVIALANGGKHSWENVRLAHCKCNTEKSNKWFGENQNVQLVLFF